MNANPQSGAALAPLRDHLRGLEHKGRGGVPPLRRGGMTCDEVEYVTGLKHQTASARVRDLSREGKLEASGLFRKTSSGRDACVYRLSASGRDWLGR